MKSGLIAILAATVIVTPLLAAETQPGLAPGKPAGLKKAQLADGEVAAIAIGGVALIAGLIISNQGNSPGVAVTPATAGSSTTTTTTTST
jgi:hypothetical protein